LVFVGHWEWLYVGEQFGESSYLPDIETPWSISALFLPGKAIYCSFSTQAYPSSARAIQTNQETVL
jgi:hypothetical protein